MDSTTRGAVVLASGGLDSTTVLAIAQEQGFEVVALTLRYDQTHALEVERCGEICRRAGVARHLVLDLPLGRVGGSALTGDGEIPLESADPAADAAGGVRAGAEARPAIPATYVPARNLIFLAVATAVAEARGVRDIYIGVNHLDYAGYPDCRPAFMESFARTANLGTREGVEHSEPWFRIHAPLIELSKSQIITRGCALGVDYSMTLSCYAPDATGRACGRCESCGLRRRGFREAGVADPTVYQV